MERGNPLRFEALLPAGMTMDDVLLMAAALALFMIVWSLSELLITRNPFEARLKMIAQRRAELKGNMLAAQRRKKSEAPGTIVLIRQIVRQLKLLRSYQLDQLQTKLTQAGYRSKDAVAVFAFAKLVMPFVCIGIAFMLASIDWAHPFGKASVKGWLIFLILGFLGLRLPEILVANKKAHREHGIRKALPDALDLMMICAEAGLSLAAALDRVARELGRMSPDLAEELSLTSVELGFLPDRSVALKHLAERIDIKEVRGIVNVITQTEKYGTPIAQALRTLAKEYRTERMLRAEQKAARLPALMTVPMIVFILPALFIIVLAPAIINVMDTM